MCNKTQIYCNTDNNYRVHILKKLEKDLHISIQRMKERELEIQELYRQQPYTAQQLVKIGRLKIDRDHLKTVIKNVRININSFTNMLLIC